MALEIFMENVGSGEPKMHVGTLAKPFDSKTFASVVGGIIAAEFEDRASYQLNNADPVEFKFTLKEMTAKEVAALPEM